MLLAGALDRSWSFSFGVVITSDVNIVFVTDGIQ
jgi:hypothetical protein